MATTAFPVLARIIHERGLTSTPIGTLALSAGAIDDDDAWCMLAIVLALFGGSALGAAIVIAGVLAYAVVTLTLGRRLLAHLSERTARAQRLSLPMMAAVLALVAFGAWLTDQIGIHGVLGGFLIGAAMPRGLLASEHRRRLEPLVATFVLPMFFAFAGLKTHQYDMGRTSEARGAKLSAL